MKPTLGAFSRYMRRPLQALQPLRARLRNFTEGMSPRDRLLFMGTVVVLSLGFLVFGTVFMLGRLDSLRELVEIRQGQLAQVEEMRTAYTEGQTRLEELEKRLGAYKGTTLSAFLEQSAGKVQIQDNLKQVKERSAAVHGNLEEKLFSVELSRLTLEQVVSFLYEVETSGYPLIIRTAKFRTVYVSGQKLLKLNMDISSFRLLEEDEVTG